MKAWVAIFLTVLALICLCHALEGHHRWLLEWTGRSDFDGVQTSWAERLWNLF